MDPEVGFSKPASSIIREVLPDPLFPIMANVSCFFMASVIPLITSVTSEPF